MNSVVMPSLLYVKFLEIAAFFKRNKPKRDPDEWVRAHVFFPVTSIAGEKLSHVVMRRGDANNYEYRALSEDEKEEMFSDLAW
ncbi:MULTISPECIES: hypothetical protein [Agrobacterium]|uniref:hypothetical protein n=1 Tax=Agrobacterium tumefaciens TaxID=358 RepID=UPI001571C138|nr:hypothetical protein [Agrobacterium tumefaciens]NSZ06093.1 hypothetical protein [Agrobacterium tumefaciens]